MAEEQNTVEVRYTGSGGSSSELAPYNDGHALIENGDTFEVPEDLARGLILSVDFEATDGRTVADFYELTEEQQRLEEAVRNRKVEDGGESAPEGLTAGDRRANSEEEALRQANGPGEGSDANAQGRVGENANPENDGGSGEQTPPNNDGGGQDNE